MYCVSVDKAKTAYNQAKDAADELATTHPIRLGLALNFSVFYYEIMNEPDKACELAKAVSSFSISMSAGNDTGNQPFVHCRLLMTPLQTWTHSKKIPIKTAP